jgi:hypothetical protein
MELIADSSGFSGMTGAGEDPDAGVWNGDILLLRHRFARSRRALVATWA